MDQQINGGKEAFELSGVRRSHFLSWILFCAESFTKIIFMPSNSSPDWCTARRQCNKIGSACCPALELNGESIIGVLADRSLCVEGGGRSSIPSKPKPKAKAPITCAHKLIHSLKGNITLIAIITLFFEQVILTTKWILQ